MNINANQAPGPATESLMGDLAARGTQRLHQYQYDQLKTRIAFRKAVLSVAGYGREIDVIA